MMFMISGRAVNANGSPIVRDGVVAAIHAAGHSVVTAQPRRGSYAYVDYLVATRDSINRHVTKVRWAAERNISVIDYAQLWQFLEFDIVPTGQELPADAAERLPTRQTTRQALADVHRQEAVDRRNRLDEEERERIQQALREEALRAANPVRVVGDYHPDTDTARTHTTTQPPKPVAPTAPPRRKIVTRR